MVDMARVDKTQSFSELEKHELAYDFHLEAMADKTQRIFVELKAERKHCMEDYYTRYDDWVDECKKLTKEDWKPP